ncbi:MAG: nucleoside deaminase [Fibrobacteria bacterium]|nr:nucleoside deaminase [Fibrobacteria bacterium]
MTQALHEAQAAFDEGEVPVGAVIVLNNQIIARAHNRIEASKDSTAHAEIIAIGAAAGYIGDWRLDDCVLYSTLEPCPMCAGAIINSRISKLVFGANDKRLGACGTACDLLSLGLLNRSIEVEKGIMQHECLGIVQAFFKSVRKK